MARQLTGPPLAVLEQRDDPEQTAIALANSDPTSSDPTLPATNGGVRVIGAIRERAALHLFHGEERRAVVFPDIVNVDDVCVMRLRAGTMTAQFLIPVARALDFAHQNPSALGSAPRRPALRKDRGGFRAQVMETVRARAVGERHR